MNFQNLPHQQSRQNLNQRCLTQAISWQGGVYILPQEQHQNYNPHPEQQSTKRQRNETYENGNSINGNQFISRDEFSDVIANLTQKFVEKQNQHTQQHQQLNNTLSENSENIKQFEVLLKKFGLEFNSQKSVIQDLQIKIDQMKVGYLDTYLANNYDIPIQKMNELNRLMEQLHKFLTEMEQQPKKIENQKEMFDTFMQTQEAKLKQIQNSIQQQYQQSYRLNSQSNHNKNQIETIVNELNRIKESIKETTCLQDVIIKDLNGQFNEMNFKQKSLAQDQIQSEQLKIQTILPNEQQGTKQRLKNVQDSINDIYNESWRKRSAQGEFRLFIRNIENLNELYRNYGIRSSSMKNDLSKICSSFRQARGDGNCFYTAFGFQFFNILLYKYSQINYEEFIQKINQVVKFQINYGQGKSIESQKLQQQCWEELKYRLNYLRKQNQEEFIKHYQSYEQSIENELIDGCFYGLSTIFFRNLANYLVDNSEMKQAVFDQQNLLIWEEECNSNEVVIDELAKFLKVQVKLVFFETGSFKVREYLEGMQHIIILLIRPGHYNIGYPPEIQESERQ